MRSPPCASPPRPTDNTMDERRSPSPETDPISLVGAAVLDALELMDLPAYVIDRKGTLRWANTAVSRLIDDRVGHSSCTEAIASRLGVAVETARNHIRAVLRELGVHSRLEAVVAGRERGLLDE